MKSVCTSMLVTSLLLSASLVASSECRLWLAPSNLATDENVKFGLFAGVDFQENELLPNPELAIPMVDIAVDNYLGRENYELHREIITFLESIGWMSGFAGANWEGNHSTIIMSPGYGVLSNYHSGMHNIDWVQGAVILRQRAALELEGVASVGRGSYSDYYNMTMKATRHIPAGMELFANFGDVWDGNNGEDTFQDRLSRVDYEDADKILDKILEFMNKYDKEMKGSLKEEVLDFMLDTILEAHGGKRAKLIRSLIPPRHSKLQKVKDVGGTFAYRNRDLVKSPTWLEEHGLCVDNLRSGRSTNPHAGRGAFASRKIAHEDIVSPVPMVPILSEELLDMYQIVQTQFENNQMGLTYDRSKPIGQQLILNYCYGHMESSLLLFPVAPMVNYINHSPQPNVYLTWSAHDDVGMDHGLHDIPLGDWHMDADPKITMALVALRDIEEGEEIFIDYGPEWADAWNEHVLEYNRLRGGGSWPFKASDVQIYYDKHPFATDLKQDTIPYPDSVFTSCHIEVEDLDDGQPRHNSNGNEIFNWVGPTTWADYSAYNLVVCDVQSKMEDETNFYNYTVLTKLKDENDIIEVKNVPHAAIRLLDKPYTSDMFEAGVFRHWIAIDDDRFPQAWRNLREPPGNA